MEFGASIFFTDYSITPAEFGQALEERGFDSVWAAEHSHIPVPRKTRADQDLGKRYYDVMDPFVTLTAAACATRRAVRYGDGWYPNAASGKPEEYMPAFRKMAQETGRDPASLPVTIGGSPDDPDALKRFRDLGAARAVVTLMSETRDQLLPVLDHWAGHIRQLRG